MAKELLRKMEIELNNTSDERLEEADLVTKTTICRPVESMMPYLSITDVSVVHNNYLRLMYQLKKEEYEIRHGSVTVKRLYHATSAYNVHSIIKSNFDWRRVSRSKFGQGVSFSDNPDYANYHCNINNGSDRAFIVADVLVGAKCSGNSLMTVPPDGYDTAYGNNTVYVKFCDNEFLPLYVIFYDAPDRSKSKFFRVRRYRRRFF